MENPPNAGIKKKILHAGSGDIPKYPDDTKVTFHYQTRKCDEEKTILDDSRTAGEPMMLYLGKKFKLEAWETCIKTMREGEVASFTTDKSLIGSYPLVAKSLRDIRKGKGGEAPHHCCGMTLKEQGLGYPDLDELMKNPQDLEFILDLQKVELPGDYKKEAWTMNEEEKAKAVPRLKEEGNQLYKEKKYSEAANKYAEAIGMLEQLMLREKPGDEIWKAYDIQKIPLLLNFAQCKLLQQDYYQVIEHTSEVLKKDPDNVKALFRRAKAHVGAWNPSDAREDFHRAAQLDPGLQKEVERQLRSLDDAEKKKNEEDKAKFRGKMFS